MDDREKVFAFDVGKASLGICVRDGDNILDLQSLIIPPDFAATSDFRARRRAMRTREAHKKREQWLCSVWERGGLAPIDRQADRFKREFPRKGEEKIYNSALLRIALLQDKPLEEWQIFKALWSSIQLRGYETVAWTGNRRGKDASTSAVEGDPESLSAEEKEKLKEEKENAENAEKYLTRLHEAISPHFEYEFPCFLEAYRMGLWNAEQPLTLQLRYSADKAPLKVRRKAGHDSADDPGNTAPRSLVEKEIRQLFGNAGKQLPALARINADELLYGPSGKPYASYLEKEYSRYRGTEWDAQGVLSQKIPRFDNRILNKCQMLPKRNVCKASAQESLDFTLLMKLKNIRYTDDNGEVGLFLSSEQLKAVYELCKQNLDGKKTQDITQGNVVKFIEKAAKTRVRDINIARNEKIKVGGSGRSRFCRPALKIMNEILLSGVNPPEFDVSPYVQEDRRNGITRKELEDMIGRLGKTWEGFHVGDKRYVDLEKAEKEGGRERAIQKLIGSVNNPVVRHRLTIFWNQLKKLEDQHGRPGRVILEFVRGGEGLNGQKTAADWEWKIKFNEKKNDRIREQLDEYGLKAHKWNIERFKMAEDQQWRCPYTGEQLHAGQLEHYQVDHIVPLAGEVGHVASDAFYNKVLCTHTANQQKKKRTPFEWFHQDKSDEEWQDYVTRITDKNSNYGRKKQELLIRKDAPDLLESYNGLAETAYIARLAQQITGLHFGWGLQTEGDQRKVFVNDGKTTAKIRQVYKLNELLLTGEDKARLTQMKDAGQQRTFWKKNRENPKHHALDAYCISYSQELRLKEKEDGYVEWIVPGLEHSKAQLERRLIDLFPNNITRNTKELYPMETIYGYRSRMENGKQIHYLTVRKKLTDILGKDRKKITAIFDHDIRADLQKKSEEIKDAKAWLEFLQSYTHPKRSGRVHNVLLIESRSETPLQLDKAGRAAFGEYKDFGNADPKEGKKGITVGQYKHTKANKGQLIYNSGKNWKVQQVYAHENTEAIIEYLLGNGCKLYKDGMLFYPGCRIFVPVPFKAGKTELPGGLYKSRTMRADGIVLVENSNGEEFHTNIKYLVDAEFELAGYDDKAVKVLSNASE